VRKYIAALVASSLVWLVAPTADAEVVTRSDPDPACSQRPALDLKRATFNYDDDRFVFKLKMGALSRKRTQAFARYTLGYRQGSRYDVLLRTKFDSDGDKQVVGRWYSDTGEYGRFTDGLTANWDWQRKVIKFTLTSHLRGRKADAWAYTIPKGVLHGGPCGDYIWSGRISRG
jgi:hypothetical protein